jgi:hypothetical protein
MARNSDSAVVFDVELFLRAPRLALDDQIRLPTPRRCGFVDEKLLKTLSYPR